MFSGQINSIAVLPFENRSGNSDTDYLSDGIAEAMNCTAFGLIVAIPALVAFSLLQGRTQHMIDDINETAVGVLNLIVANKEKMKLPSA